MSNWRSSGSYAAPAPFRLVAREAKHEGSVLDVNGVEVGADGLLVEVHCNPQDLLSDGPQSLHPDRFDQMMHELSAVVQSVDRTVATVSPTELVASGGIRS